MATDGKTSESKGQKFSCRDGEGFNVHLPSKIVIHFLKGKGQRVEVQVTPLPPATRIDNRQKPIDTVEDKAAAVSG